MFPTEICDLICENLISLAMKNNVHHYEDFTGCIDEGKFSFCVECDESEDNYYWVSCKY